MKDFLAYFRWTFADVCCGYSQVFFSKRWYAGALFMAGTFVVPAQGFAGLTGLLLSNFAAMVCGLPREHIRQGYYAYNGLLTGLALGITYRANLPFFLSLVAISFLGVFVAASVRSIFERYIGTPPLSVPFVLTTWLAITAGRGFSSLVYTLDPFEVSTLAGLLPPNLDYFVRSVGATFFQLSVPSGILVALGLLLSSRLAFLLAIVGVAAGTVFYTALGGRIEDLTGGWIGFNFVLTAIAVGGVWSVPGAASLLLATFGAVLTAIVSSGSIMMLKPMGLPVLAFPFVATTTVILYAMKEREKVNHIQSLPIPYGSPEENAKVARSANARMLRTDLPAFELPFHGEWTVTQGFFGEITHQGLWAHAWDFEVIGSDGRSLKGDGSNVADFLCYKLPALCPGDGQVVRVVDHIQDNPVGQVNKESNWGNQVIIWHYGSVYTALCHLAQEEICVKEGARVKSGEIVGRIGSSGRSPAPHLHFQVQNSAETGAPTIPAEVLHYVTRENGSNVYHTRGVPGEEQSVKMLIPDSGRFAAASFPLGRSWKYVVLQEGKMCEEVWESETDFAGNRYLSSRKPKASLRLYVDQKALIFLDYQGRERTGLSWLYLALPRIPLTKMDVLWEDKLPPDLLFPVAFRWFFDLFEPFLPLATLKTSSRFTGLDDNPFEVETVLELSSPMLRNKRRLELVSRLDCKCGLVSLMAKKAGKVVCELYQIEQETEDTAPENYRLIEEGD